ncbi:family 63 glycoside hydrolase [Cryphonectria parasitica EP155]|uniref:Mannosyl-oligosaccharide glucosidase n=1 Tax=Cryphonectria parasitica (strain ATCC 38755 / EP155) TaxID=660469 RepID=A0A9P4YD82_CRYP1|nr:family 63 glycoside hydrolase [Cryphonectria parasitica EP155]KAF3771223.1 family 63 glycoside hydrolase [Cryphonectria parasitica EP155]
MATPRPLAVLDEAVLNAEIGRLNNQSLHWGPYRPNLYFGVRQRAPNSLLTGLMWSNVDNYQVARDNFRYTCEQHQGMAGYGWDEYDIRKGGVQTIHDSGNGIDITTSFIKVPGGANGGSWAARIKGVPRPGVPDDARTQVVLFLGQEGFGSTIEPQADGDDNGFPSDVTFSGSSDSLGNFKVVVTKGTGEHPPAGTDFDEDQDLEKTVVQSLNVPPELLWQAKAIAMRQISERMNAMMPRINQEAPPPAWQMYGLSNKPGLGNTHIVQKIFEGPFEFDILFSSASAGKELTSDDLTREIKETTESFGERFTSVFAPQAPFTTDRYKTFGRSMLSNLIGGIGYFYGQHLVDRSYAAEYEEDDEGFWEAAADARNRKEQKLEGPYELFSSIPSRPFFPRGFLWDEGFHLLPIADWDMDLTLEILKSWFNLMDEDGWIPREMILGEEARSKVPEEFQVQYPHYANPPTLFFVIDTYIAKLQKIANGSATSQKEKLSQGESLGTAYLDNSELGLDYLRRLYPLMRRQFEWFKKTQYGDIKSYDREAYSSKEAYRWRGRTPRHVLTSGMDDYPRPQPPHPAELHVDLMAWVGMMTKSLINVAQTIGIAEDVEEFKKILDAIEHNLDDLHWSEAEGCYCDATIDDYEENQLVCYKGYVSLMPFLTGLLKPDSPKLGKILDLIGDDEELWSPHGIRSLSKKSEFYGTDENYWRSPVWININYMAVTQLYNVATQPGPHQAKAKDLYSRLRRNLVETIYKSWEETGFAWEQYNPETGAGQRTQHFTGWTSLVVKIMAMPDLGGSGGHVRDEL